MTLDIGKNKVEIEVDDDQTESKSEYTVYIFRGGKEAVYLKDINIDGNTIGFDKSNTFYNVELDEGTDMTELETVPEDDSYLITINGVELNETNSIKVKFKGIKANIYTLNIEIKDKDTDRIGKCTLKIYVGVSISPNISDSINSVLKPNQWVIVNGRWRYNDVLGNCLKNTWYYDTKYKSYFHFNNLGNMQTDWIDDGGNWYYLNSKGEMETGWIKYEDKWYYLNSKGAMQIGWVKDEGKWYYLRRDGTMAKGWIVNNDQWYYLDSSGSMHTGWIYHGGKWYFLADNGAMKTDWIKINNDWYLFNDDGSMKSGEWLFDNGNWYYLTNVGNMRYDNINDIKRRGWLYIENDDKFYYFNEDGTMRTNSITIDGYTYNFNEDGSVNFQ